MCPSYAFKCSLDCVPTACRSRNLWISKGLGAYSRAAVRDLNIITSLAHRIALIATNPQPARNSQSLLSHFSDAAARARNRLHSYNHALDDSMLPHPESHFTQELFHAEMLCARGKIFQVSFLTYWLFLAFLPYQTSLSQALADSEDLTGTQLKQKAKSLVLQVAAVVLMRICLFHRN